MIMRTFFLSGSALLLCILSVVSSGQALAQSHSSTGSNGTGPSYTFEGNKRMIGQKPAAGMQEYKWARGDDSSIQHYLPEPKARNVTVTVAKPNRKPDAKPATTVVQLQEPNGRLQYKEVKFCGELFTNKGAATSTVVRDKEGGIKEYTWIKKKTLVKTYSKQRSSN